MTHYPVTDSRGGYETRLLELIAEADQALKTFIMTMLEVRRAMIRGYTALHKTLIAIVAKDHLCRSFMTVPGVGPLAALSFRAGVDDPLRFTRSKTVGTHFGLTPRKWQLGTVNIQGSELRLTRFSDCL